MQGKPEVLYQHGKHLCLAFNDLVEGEGVQSNQFLIMDGEQSILLDPGGDLTYIPLNIAITRYLNPKNLDYIFASHQDPDIIASIDRWVVNTSCQVLVSRLWGRFLPHLVSTHVDKQVGDFNQRVIQIPDEGFRLPFGDHELVMIPAHFLHSVGNFQLYDPVSKILFSGDMGASIGGDESSAYVTDFAAHIPLMKGFHQRYMGSNKAAMYWARMVSKLDVEMIVPQHGQAFKGQAMINCFLDWISELECGIDLLRQASFTVPATLHQA